MTSTHTHPARTRVRFDLPPELSATAPPEARGLARDQVRLLVARPDGIEPTRFAALGAHLEPGDLLVVNTSATLAAALDGRRGGARWDDGAEVVVHVAGPHPDGAGWIVELRRPDAAGPVLDGERGEVVALGGGARMELREAMSGRLWRAHIAAPDGVLRHLATHGRPIAYGYVPERWPLETYQTVFAWHPGSAEMASAARPFTTTLVTELVARGITIAPIVLHTGVSSLEAGEAPLPERFEVPAHTAALVELTRRRGGRVVAVGTTATRALESAADVDGSVHAASGWTDVVLGPERPARVVDGLVTGWHESDASHLALLEAVAGPELVERAYAVALADGFLWHEFGDSCLLLP